MVYLGNYFGNQVTVIETLNELLLMRRKLMALERHPNPMRLFIFAVPVRRC